MPYFLLILCNILHSRVGFKKKWKMRMAVLQLVGYNIKNAKTAEKWMFLCFIERK